MSELVGVLAVQGAFVEHERMLARLGVPCVELRQACDLARPVTRLVLPGGESTTQGKLLAELGMLDELRNRVAGGMPTLATCAGLILLARRLEAHDDKGTPRLATLDVLVRRNAYGRQLASFRAQAPFACPSELLAKTVGPTFPTPAAGGDGVRPSAHVPQAPRKVDPSYAEPDAPVPLTFIRAPQIVRTGPGVEVLAACDGHPVAVLQGAQLACAFHPELDSDPRVHEAFLAL